jgi:hypothetical protein
MCFNLWGFWLKQAAKISIIDTPKHETALCKMQKYLSFYQVITIKLHFLYTELSAWSHHFAIEFLSITIHLGPSLLTPPQAPTLYT